MAALERLIVVGVFAERGAADRAIEELQRAGFRNEQIRLEQQESTPSRVVMPGGNAGGVPTASGTTAGTPTPISPADEPGTQGGLIGSIKSLFGGHTDTHIADDLVTMGIPKENADYYQREFELNHAVVVVEAGDRREDALVILRSNGAYDVTTPRGNEPNTQTRTTTSDDSLETDDAMVRPERDEV